jgi:hypothetical protein
VLDADTAPPDIKSAAKSAAKRAAFTVTVDMHLNRRRRYSPN